MALVPEFFTILGIEIFLVISMLSAILDHHLPSRLQYLFQGSAGLGLAELLAGEGLVPGQAPTYQIRFWISIVYLALALSSVAGTNILLAVRTRGKSLAPAFSSAVTVPFLLVSALFIFAFLGSRDVTFSPTAMLTLATLVIMASLSTFGFLREFSKRIQFTHGGILPLPIGPMSVSVPQGTPEDGLLLDSSSATGEIRISSRKSEEWEEAPKKEDGGA